MDDPEAYGEVDVRFLQPYQANKWYVCPNCNRDIEPGTGHYAIVPKEAPDLRRHWHRGCWDGGSKSGTEPLRCQLGEDLGSLPHERWRATCPLHEPWAAHIQQMRGATPTTSPKRRDLLWRVTALPNLRTLRIPTNS